mmetsp:Transcript_27471/g.36742  ORF Transcript_27471/g.36742 Transcript_27471/m.36742 type:complete len:170 (-) Transcript_27471:321-830(-)
MIKVSNFQALIDSNYKQVSNYIHPREMRKRRKNKEMRSSECRSERVDFSPEPTERSQQTGELRGACSGSASENRYGGEVGASNNKSNTGSDSKIIMSGNILKEDNNNSGSRQMLVTSSSLKPIFKVERARASSKSNHSLDSAEPGTTGIVVGQASKNSSQEICDRNQII